MFMLEMSRNIKILIILLLLIGCTMKIRPSCCAGTWYNENKEELKKEIDDYLKNAKDEGLNVKAIIVPHAGYAYSGQVAAHGLKQIKDAKRVIVLGTPHTYPLDGVSMLDVDYYETPLGKVKLCNVKRDESIQNIPEAHREEHSIELELPFLQETLKDFCIVPIIVGRTDPIEFKEYLEDIYNEDTAIVVSVDLSHFHNYTTAKRLDNNTINSILNLESERIEDDEVDSPYAVMSVIELAKTKGWKTKLLEYKNSGDITGDKTSVVGYSAIAFYEEAYTEEEKQFMLDLAEQSVEQYLKNGTKPKLKLIPEKLKQERACFVTLTIKGQLRGCIGNLNPVGPLYQGIIDNAISAAINDNRFEQVTEDELKSIDYEISVLTEPKKISYKDEKDLFNQIKNKGVILKKGAYSSTYLPQVWEQVSDEMEFLTSLSMKVGLEQDAWKNMDIYIYDAIIIE